MLGTEIQPCYNLSEYNLSTSGYKIHEEKATKSEFSRIDWLNFFDSGVTERDRGGGGLEGQKRGSDGETGRAKRSVTVSGQETTNPQEQEMQSNPATNLEESLAEAAQASRMEVDPPTQQEMQPGRPTILGTAEANPFEAVNEEDVEFAADIDEVADSLEKEVVQASIWPIYAKDPGTAAGQARKLVELLITNTIKTALGDEAAHQFVEALDLQNDDVTAIRMERFNAWWWAAAEISTLTEAAPTIRAALFPYGPRMVIPHNATEVTQSEFAIFTGPFVSAEAASCRMRWYKDEGVPSTTTLDVYFEQIQRFLTERGLERLPEPPESYSEGQRKAWSSQIAVAWGIGHVGRLMDAIIWLTPKGDVIAVAPTHDCWSRMVELMQKPAEERTLEVVNDEGVTVEIAIKLEHFDARRDAHLARRRQQEEVYADAATVEVNLPLHMLPWEEVIWPALKETKFFRRPTATEIRQMRSKVGPGVLYPLKLTVSTNAAINHVTKNFAIDWTEAAKARMLPKAPPRTRATVPDVLKYTTTGEVEREIKRIKNQEMRDQFAKKIGAANPQHRGEKLDRALARANMFTERQARDFREEAAEPRAPPCAGFARHVDHEQERATAPRRGEVRGADARRGSKRGDHARDVRASRGENGESTGKHPDESEKRRGGGFARLERRDPADGSSESTEGNPFDAGRNGRIRPENDDTVKTKSFTFEREREGNAKGRPERWWWAMVMIAITLMGGEGRTKGVLLSVTPLPVAVMAIMISEGIRITTEGVEKLQFGKRCAHRLRRDLTRSTRGGEEQKAEKKKGPRRITRSRVKYRWRNTMLLGTAIMLGLIGTANGLKGSQRGPHREQIIRMDAFEGSLLSVATHEFMEGRRQRLNKSAWMGIKQPENFSKETDLNFLSINIKSRGMNALEQIQAIIDIEKPDVLALQETGLSEKEAKNWEGDLKHVWGEKGNHTMVAYHTPRAVGNSNTGTSLLISRELASRSKKSEEIRDKEGRYTILTLEGKQGTKLKIASFYGVPCPDQKREEAETAIKRFKEDIMKETGPNIHRWVATDLNAVQNVNKDRDSNRTSDKTESIHKMFRAELDLTDIWREQNPEEKVFTWYGHIIKSIIGNKMADKIGTHKGKSRIDFQMISSHTRGRQQAGTWINTNWTLDWTDHALLKTTYPQQLLLGVPRKGRGRLCPPPTKFNWSKIIRKGSKQTTTKKFAQPKNITSNGAEIEKILAQLEEEQFGMEKTEGNEKNKTKKEREMEAHIQKMIEQQEMTFDLPLGQASDKQEIMEEWKALRNGLTLAAGATIGTKNNPLKPSRKFCNAESYRCIEAASWVNTLRTRTYLTQKEQQKWNRITKKRWDQIEEQSRGVTLNTIQRELLEKAKAIRSELRRTSWKDIRKERIQAFLKPKLKGDQKSMIAYITGKSTEAIRLGGVREEDGTFNIAYQAIRRTMTTFQAEVFKTRVPQRPKTTPMMIKKIFQGVPRISEGKMEEAGLGNPLAPLKEEEKHYLMSLRKMDTAPGPSGLSYRALLHTHEKVTERVFALINSILLTGNFPSELGWSYTSLLLKKEGVHSLSNTRPVCLQETMGKLVMLVMAGRVAHLDRITRNTPESLYTETQHGFRDKHGTTDPLLQMMAIAEDAKRFDKELHVLECDIKGAFSSVEFWSFDYIYELKGFSPAFRRLMRNVDNPDTQQTAVITEAGVADRFRCERGCAQGCPFSPARWAIFVDPLLRYLEKQGEDTGYKMERANKNISGADEEEITRSLTFTHNAYADDIQLWSNSNKGICCLTKITLTYFDYNGLWLAPAKCFYKARIPGARVGKKFPENVTKLDIPRVKEPVTNDWKEVQFGDRRLTTRYLGVFWNLDLDWTEQEAIIDEELTRICSRWRSIKLPLEICEYIHNQVMIPKITYRTMITGAAKATQHRWSKMLLGAVKTSAGLATAQPNCTLRAGQEWGLGGLKKLKDEIDVTMIREFWMHAQRKGQRLKSRTAIWNNLFNTAREYNCTSNPLTNGLKCPRAKTYSEKLINATKRLGIGLYTRWSWGESKDDDPNLDAVLPPDLYNKLRTTWAKASTAHTKMSHITNPEGTHFMRSEEIERQGDFKMTTQQHKVYQDMIKRLNGNNRTFAQNRIVPVHMRPNPKKPKHFQPLRTTARVGDFTATKNGERIIRISHIKRIEDKVAIWGESWERMEQAEDWWKPTGTGYQEFNSSNLVPIKRVMTIDKNPEDEEDETDTWWLQANLRPQENDQTIAELDATLQNSLKERKGKTTQGDYEGIKVIYPTATPKLQPRSTKFEYKEAITLACDGSCTTDKLEEGEDDPTETIKRAGFGITCEHHGTYSEDLRKFMPSATEGEGLEYDQPTVTRWTSYLGELHGLLRVITIHPGAVITCWMDNQSVVDTFRYMTYPHTNPRKILNTPLLPIWNKVILAYHEHQRQGGKLIFKKANSHVQPEHGGCPLHEASDEVAKTASRTSPIIEEDNSIWEGADEITAFVGNKPIQEKITKELQKQLQQKYRAKWSLGNYPSKAALRQQVSEEQMKAIGLAIRTRSIPRTWAIKALTASLPTKTITSKYKQNLEPKEEWEDRRECRLCMEEDDDNKHAITECPGLAPQREETHAEVGRMLTAMGVEPAVEGEEQKTERLWRALGNAGAPPNKETGDRMLRRLRKAEVPTPPMGLLTLVAEAAGITSATTTLGTHLPQGLVFQDKHGGQGVLHFAKNRKEAQDFVKKECQGNKSAHGIIGLEEDGEEEWTNQQEQIRRICAFPRGTITLTDGQSNGSRYHLLRYHSSEAPGIQARRMLEAVTIWVKYNIKAKVKEAIPASTEAAAKLALQQFTGKEITKEQWQKAGRGPYTNRKINIAIEGEEYVGFLIEGKIKIRNLDEYIIDTSYENVIEEIRARNEAPQRQTPWWEQEIMRSLQTTQDNHNINPHLKGFFLKVYQRWPTLGEAKWWKPSEEEKTKAWAASMGGWDENDMKELEKVMDKKPNTTTRTLLAGTAMEATRRLWKHRNRTMEEIDEHDNRPQDGEERHGKESGMKRNTRLSQRTTQIKETADKEKKNRTSLQKSRETMKEWLKDSIPRRREETGKVQAGDLVKIDGSDEWMTILEEAVIKGEKGKKYAIGETDLRGEHRRWTKKGWTSFAHGCDICGEATQFLRQHPTADLMICAQCRETIYTGTFTTDEEGYHDFCQICGDGSGLGQEDSIILCENEECKKATCRECLKRAFDEEPGGKEEKWTCPPCRCVPTCRKRTIQESYLALEEITEVKQTVQDSHWILTSQHRPNWKEVKRQWSEKLLPFQRIILGATSEMEALISITYRGKKHMTQEYDLPTEEEITAHALSQSERTTYEMEGGAGKREEEPDKRPPSEIRRRVYERQSGYVNRATITNTIEEGTWTRKERREKGGERSITRITDTAYERDGQQQPHENISNTQQAETPSEQQEVREEWDIIWPCGQEPASDTESDDSAEEIIVEDVESDTDNVPTEYTHTKETHRTNRDSAQQEASTETEANREGEDSATDDDDPAKLAEVMPRLTNGNNMWATIRNDITAIRIYTQVVLTGENEVLADQTEHTHHRLEQDATNDREDERPQRAPKRKEEAERNEKNAAQERTKSESTGKRKRKDKGDTDETEKKGHSGHGHKQPKSQENEKQKVNRRTTWKEKGATGCSKCRWTGCGACWKAQVARKEEEEPEEEREQGEREKRTDGDHEGGKQDKEKKETTAGGEKSDTYTARTTGRRARTRTATTNKGRGDEEEEDEDKRNGGTRKREHEQGEQERKGKRAYTRKGKRTQREEEGGHDPKPPSMGNSTGKRLRINTDRPREKGEPFRIEDWIGYTMTQREGSEGETPDWERIRGWLKETQPMARAPEWEEWLGYIMTQQEEKDSLPKEPIERLRAVLNLDDHG